MLSNRRKYKYVVNEHAVELLKTKFEEKDTSDLRENGKHVLLKWLVRCHAADTSGVVAEGVLDEIDRINALGTLPTLEALDVLLRRCAAWLAQVEVPAAYLEYMAHYFSNTHVRILVRNAGFKTYNGTYSPEDTWLSWTSVRRALVVPDVRKMALDLQWTMALRPGEREFVQRLTNNTTSTVYGALQALRPAEYLAHMRTQMLYGSLEDLHNEDMLSAVVLALIQTRMNNRSGMDWIKRCVRFAHQLELPRDTAVPLLIVEQTAFVIAFRGGAIACKDATTAFAYWCQHAPCIIDGRYDVSECTI